MQLIIVINRKMSRKNVTFSKSLFNVLRWFYIFLVLLLKEKFEKYCTPSSRRQ